jgi:hypothetical protein
MAYLGTKPANAVLTSEQIGDGVITTADLADGLITTAKIANGAVVEADIANNAVTSSKLADNAVTASKITVGASAQRLSFVRLPVTGNIAANTWYTLTDTGIFGFEGIAHLSGYSNTVGYGGNHYDLVIDGGTVPLKARTTNDAYTSATYDFGKMAGHAPNTQRYIWRVRFQGGDPRSALIEWQSNTAMSGLIDGALVFWLHATVRW